MGVGNLKGMKQEEVKLLTPSIHTLPETNPVVQPYVQLIPFPDEVNVVRVEELYNDVDSISIQLLEEFRDEILNITVIDEEADFNATIDIKELECLIATDHESSFTEIK
ncbi:hypothetical protein Tco_1316961, partial [Tanacetum coccineum]